MDKEESLRIYKKAFFDTFGVTEKELPDLKYQGIRKWDSLGHMDLISFLEEKFKIRMTTVDILDFSTFEKGKRILAKYGIEM